MPLYKLGQLKMFIWRDDAGGDQPPKEATNALINVEFDFPSILQSARIKFAVAGSGVVLDAMLYDTLNPNLDYDPSDRPMYNSHTGKYYIGVPDPQPNDPVGALRLRYPPGTVEKVALL